MSVSIQPLADNVLAQQLEAETKTASGLYLPDKAQEKPKVATVVAIGKEVKQVKVGDKIIFSSYSEQEVKHDGIDYLLVKEEKILAIVKK